jgi:hypothetical protein
MIFVEKKVETPFNYYLEAPTNNRWLDVVGDDKLRSCGGAARGYPPQYRGTRSRNGHSERSVVESKKLVDRSAMSVAEEKRVSRSDDTAKQLAALGGRLGPGVTQTDSANFTHRSGCARSRFRMWPKTLQTRSPCLSSSVSITPRTVSQEARAAHPLREVNV